MRVKLTNQAGQTYGGTQWGPDVTHTATGGGLSLCSDGWIHCYRSPLEAVLFNPMGADFANPRAWTIRTHGPTFSDVGKMGAKTVTTLREVPLPVVTSNARIRWSILVCLAAQDDLPGGWEAWADAWLSGDDRSLASARAARNVAYLAYRKDIGARTSFYTAAAAAALSRTLCAGYAAAAVYVAVRQLVDSQTEPPPDFMRLARQAIRAEVRLGGKGGCRDAECAKYLTQQRQK